MTDTRTSKPLTPYKRKSLNKIIERHKMCIPNLCFPRGKCHQVSVLIHQREDEECGFSGLLSLKHKCLESPLVRVETCHGPGTVSGLCLSHTRLLISWASTPSSPELMSCSSCGRKRPLKDWQQPYPSTPCPGKMHRPW